MINVSPYYYISIANETNTSHQQTNQDLESNENSTIAPSLNSTSNNTSEIMTSLSASQ